MKRIFIDGREGTTGLRIVEMLSGRGDVELIDIPDDARKDPDARAKRINAADAVILCLPDDAARESVSLCTNPRVKIIDASTAHRVSVGFTYGFPELNGIQRERIAQSTRIANPGCYAIGFISMAAPLVTAGIIDKNARVTVNAISGYSGAGKRAIAQYESPDHDPLLNAPRAYALSLAHKHLPEMRHYAGLNHAPLFSPMIDDYAQGMLVFLPLPGVNANAAHDALNAHYSGERFVRVVSPKSDEFIGATGLNGTNMLEIAAAGNEKDALIIARLDNLGKGAGGSAVQCLNIALGVDECAGLI